MLLRRDFRFEAAHTTGTNEACQALHGHGYRLRVTLEGTPDPLKGYMMDFDELEAIVRKQVLARVDHAYLNDIIANPTSENLLIWAWQQLEAHLEGLFELALWETMDNCVIYRGEPIGQGTGPSAGTGGS